MGRKYVYRIDNMNSAPSSQLHSPANGGLASGTRGQNGIDPTSDPEDFAPLIQSDVVNNGTHVGLNGAERDTDEDGEGEGVPRSAKSMKSSKAQVSVVRLDPAEEEGLEDDVEPKDEDTQDEEEVNTSGNESATSADKPRTNFSKTPKASVKTGRASLMAGTAESATGTPTPAPRRRGRPSKAETARAAKAAPAPSASASAGSRGKRKRSDEADGVRKSSRAAAGLASQQISELSNKRARISAPPAKPTAPGRKVGAKAKASTTKSAATKTATRGRKSATAVAAAKPEFEVETIVDSRQDKKKGTTEYLVKWKGYRHKDNTWEPAANLTHCTQALKAFRAKGSK